MLMRPPHCEEEEEEEEEEAFLSAILMAGEGGAGFSLGPR